MVGQIRKKSSVGRQRICIDDALWSAVEITAAAHQLHSSTLVERALRCYLDPVVTIDKAARMVREQSGMLAEIRDEIRVIADFVAAEASDNKT